MILRETKFRHHRFAFLTEAASLSLERWLAVRPTCDHDFVFIPLHSAVNGLHQPINPGLINKMLNQLKAAAGIPREVRITPGKFRHTFATAVA